jgi:hypothetical protein
MPGPEALRQLIGREIHVDERGGTHHRGRLLNVNRRSLWLVEDDDDCFIPLCDVADLRAAG